ncbi:GNAT family N-acetyltransferase [Nocardia transvalensis]|uniref:GNAT family N-acetyltransferase n=1 Tax=Nocardia transvalensis TaxID=37333 RepID=UPI0018963CAA|nr:GNAT family N-acetyltransferase [Nocardia transvalensis]MBF6333478.1 hypothetical protein [Nocardia transvalensis]
MTITVRDAQCGGTPAAGSSYRRLLAKLDEHYLRDGAFLTDRWLRTTSADGWVRLIARQDAEFVGFLAGLPRTGHISILGAITPGRGVGAALLGAFADRASQSGATRLTVAIDSKPANRWKRRRFFERQGFVSAGSAVHFTKSLP